MIACRDRGQFLFQSPAATDIIGPVCKYAATLACLTLAALGRADVYLLVNECGTRTVRDICHIMIMPTVAAVQVVDAIAPLTRPQIRVERVPATSDPPEIVPGIEILTVVRSVVITEVEVV